MSTAPFEIIVAPLSVYAAPVGEAFPDVDEAPAGNWTLLGTNGTENMEGGGLTVAHNQTVDYHRPYGTTAPVKATRSSEDVLFTFTLWDLLAAEYSRILNDNAVAATAAGSGTPGFDQVNLYRGLNVSRKAWLFRGADASPEGTGWNLQFELPIGVLNSSPSVAFAKNAPAGLLFEVMGIFDGSQSAGEELGRLIVQTAAALP